MDRRGGHSAQPWTGTARGPGAGAGRSIRGALEAMRQRVDEQPSGYGGWGLWHALFVAVRVAAACEDTARARAWLTQIAGAAADPAGSARRSVCTVMRSAGARWHGWRAAAQRRSAHWQAALGTGNRMRSDGPGLRTAGAACGSLPARRRAGAGGGLARARVGGARRRPAAAHSSHWARCAELARRGSGRTSATACPASDACRLGRLAGAGPGSERDGGPASAGAVDAIERLTAREMQVLARIAAGDSNKLIARSFDLSLHTVKRHVANVLGKLGVDDARPGGRLVSRAGALTGPRGVALRVTPAASPRRGSPAHRHWLFRAMRPIRAQPDTAVHAGGSPPGP